jgi:hypothetical protein
MTENEKINIAKNENRNIVLELSRTETLSTAPTLKCEYLTASENKRIKKN